MSSQSRCQPRPIWTARTRYASWASWTDPGPPREEPGARFENLVALHLLKLVDPWNDRGHGDFALAYVRDKERREVDFLITDRRRPYLLLETKLSADQPSPALRYFRDRLRPEHAVQLVRRGMPRKSDGILVLPADTLLGRL